MEDQSRFDEESRKRIRDAGSPEEDSRRRAPAEDDDDLDFVVTEAASEQSEFDGEPQRVTDKTDALGIEATAGSAADRPEESTVFERHHGDDDPDTQRPIGMTEPPPPPGVHDDLGASEPRGSAPQFRPSNTNKASTNDPSQLPKLTAEQIKSIREKMYRQSNGLSDRDKQELLSRQENPRPLFDNEPIVPPKKKPGDTRSEFNAKATQVRSNLRDDLAPVAPEATAKVASRLARPDHPHPAPQMAAQDRGTAYFFKNIVQLPGRHDLKAGEILELSDRKFELYPKQINAKVLYVAAAIVGLVLLVFVGAMFVSDPTGEGQLMGIVLDESGLPFIQTASIRFPELGRTIQSNAQGFFSLGTVPEGSYKVQYLIGERVIGEDFATVVDGEATLIALRPGSPATQDQQNLAADSQKNQTQPTAQGELSSSTPSKSAPASSDTEGAAATKKTNSASKSQSAGKVKLLANVEGAKLELDGTTVGAGNLVFSKIGAGRHKYTVSAAGYEPEVGFIDIQPQETATLKVVLAPLPVQEKTKTYSAEDYFHSGMNALSEKRNEAAIADFTQAIEQSPGYAEAYNSRAEAYFGKNDLSSAHGDFVRAAEIFTIQKQFGEAVNAYNRALVAAPKSVFAYLGRGNLHLIQGQDIAAITDFDVAMDIDDKNPAVHLGLGKARFNQQNYKKAIDHFKDARKYDPKNPVTYQYLMLSYLATDKVKDVQKSYEKFKEVASEKQIQSMQTDGKFAAVMRVVEEK